MNGGIYFLKKCITYRIYDVCNNQPDRLEKKKPQTPEHHHSWVIKKHHPLETKRNLIGFLKKSFTSLILGTTWGKNKCEHSLCPESNLFLLIQESFVI